MLPRSTAGWILSAILVLGSVVSIGAQQAFGLEKPLYNLVVPAFTDKQVTQLVTTLDAQLAKPAKPEKWVESARSTLSEFGRRLQMGRLTPAQEVRVLAHLEAVERTYPDYAALTSGPRSVVRSLMVGKTAPEIDGKDLDGKPFRLSDYRGKVVVLAFWGEWCGICRTSYPYERLLEELYKNWPFAIVGVNSDESRETARRAIAQQQLTYRSWWDGDGAWDGDAANGPIAEAWNVGGWPAVYVIDARGVIRYIDLAHEDLLKGVRQLLTEEQLRSSAVPTRPTRPAR